jgi:hypothetical protein
MKLYATIYNGQLAFVAYSETQKAIISFSYNGSITQMAVFTKNKWYMKEIITPVMQFKKGFIDTEFVALMHKSLEKIK